MPIPVFAGRRFTDEEINPFAGAVQNALKIPAMYQDLLSKKLTNKYYGPNIESEMGLRNAQTQGENIKNKYLPETLENSLIESRFKRDNPLLSQTGNAGQIGALLYLQQHPELAQKQQARMAAQQNMMPNSQQQAEGQSFIPSIMQQQMPTQGNDSVLNRNPQDLLMQSILKSLQPKQIQYAPSNIGKLQQEYADIQAGFYPNTGRQSPFESAEKQDEVAAPYKEKLGGLKTGEHFVYDPATHEKIGTQRPYSESERKVETGRTFFNEVFPHINNGFKDFIGKNSINNFVKYAEDYGKNPVATKKIDDLLLAQKLTAAAVVNEASTLGAGRTNQTFKNLAKSFPNSDIPALIQRYGNELRLPTKAFVKAGNRFQDIVSQSTTNAARSVPALKTLYYNPEKYMPNEENKESNKSAVYSDEDVRSTAQKYGISEAEVRKKLKEESQNG